MAQESCHFCLERSRSKKVFWEREFFGESVECCALGALRLARARMIHDHSSLTVADDEVDSDGEEDGEEDESSEDPGEGEVGFVFGGGGGVFGGEGLPIHAGSGGGSGQGPELFEAFGVADLCGVFAHELDVDPDGFVVVVQEHGSFGFIDACFEVLGRWVRRAKRRGGR